MNDWKSKKVDIEVWYNWSDLVYHESGTHLDTDTMGDLFARFDPSLYTFSIQPSEEEDGQ